MKTLRTLLGTLAVAALLAAPAVANDGTPTTRKPARASLAVDPAQSAFSWTGRKVTGQHTGTVKLAKGTLDVDGTKLLGGNFVIDMQSIVCTDLTDAESNGKFMGHIKSPDFFDVAKHPTAALKITKVVPIANAKPSEANYTVSGDLTIKGITKPVTFPATVVVSGTSATATANFKVDRTKWDIKYGSGNFFQNLGDKTINDDFEVDLKVVAAK